MEDLIALTKTLVQSQIQQQEQQKLFREQLLDLQVQQRNDTKALYEAILLKNPVNSSFTAEGIANSITEFKFNPEEGITFPAYFKRFETIFEKKM